MGSRAPHLDLQKIGTSARLVRLLDREARATPLNKPLKSSAPFMIWQTSAAIMIAGCTLPSLPSQSSGEGETKWVVPEKFFDELGAVLDSQLCQAAGATQQTLT